MIGGGESFGRVFRFADSGQVSTDLRPVKQTFYAAVPSGLRTQTRAPFFD
jgi:hypothetical protein